MCDVVSAGRVSARVHAGGLTSAISIPSFHREISSPTTPISRHRVLVLPLQHASTPMAALVSSARDLPRSVSASNPLTLRDASDKDLPTTDLYVSQIPCEVDASALRDLFSRFGPIERVYEGRKDQSARMKWAFVSFVRAEDAQ